MPDLFVMEGATPSRSDTYLHEILSHAGVFYTTRPDDGPDGSLPPIVLVHGGPVPTALRGRIERHVSEGGSLLCLGGTAGMEEVLGVGASESAAEGWLEVRDAGRHRLHLDKVQLHVFGGTTVPLRGATELASLHGRAAVTIHTYGRGSAMFIGADIPGSVLHIQQGIPVERDGTPAPDGTAPLDDGILKAEDGLVLDWERDRQTVHVPRGGFPGAWGQGARVPDPLPPEDEPMSFRLFAEPVADGLRELLLKGLFALAEAGDVPLTLLWYWPRGLPAVAHLSHDSDGNDPELAEKLRAVCRECDLPTTWCILYPGGYPPAFYRRLVEEGFEIALHFDALPQSGVRSWSRGGLARQAEWLRDMVGQRLTSNKNHYTRWEGRLDFFRWCEEEGIWVDQSKGPSKTGTIGFPFGTCHPWVPFDDERDSPRFLDVISLPLMTQDLVITAPPAYAELLTDAARAHYGVAHFLYHPAHIAKPGVAESLRHLVQYARDSGLEWWTSAEIRFWEDARRSVKWRERRGTSHLLTLIRLTDATLLRLLPSDAPCPDGWTRVTRYGFPFAQRILTLAGDTPLPRP